MYASGKVAVENTRLGATNADLRAGCIDFGSVECVLQLGGKRWSRDGLDSLLDLLRSGASRRWDCRLLWVVSSHVGKSWRREYDTH